jgi:hypothetical protein
MPRPRKNPHDPKWIASDFAIKPQESIKTQELTDVKLVLYAVSLAGVIAQNRPVSHEQAAKTAMEYAEAAMKIWS